MKILIWSQYFWPENFRINELATALHNNDIDVTVLTGKPNYPDGEIFHGYTAAGMCREEFSGMEVVRVPMLPRRNRSSLGLILNYLSFIFSGYIFAPAALRRKRFDLIFVYAPSPLLQALPAIFMAWIKRVPLVLWVQDLWPESLIATGFVKNNILLFCVRLVVRYIYHHSDLILIQSEAFRFPISRLVSNTKKIVYYPNSSADYEPISDPKPHKDKIASDIKNSFSVIFAGNIGVAQSCGTILAAAARLQQYSDIKFYLVGSGSEAAALAREIEEIKLSNVIMTGYLSPDRMPKLFSVASVLLVTLGDDPALTSTIPSKMQNYLAAGKPIIASLNGEGARIVDEAQAGISCPAEDAESLANAVFRLYEMMPSNLDRLGINGRKYFSAHFDFQKRLQELIEHFGHVTRNYSTFWIRTIIAWSIPVVFLTVAYFFVA